MCVPYLGEIRMFGGNFAPKNWAFCNGQLIAVSGNEALFSLLGVTYGGDGRTNFALPDLRGRLPLHKGTGVGLSPRPLGTYGGVEDVTLTLEQIPSHSHSFRATNSAPSSSSPLGTMLSHPPVNFYHDGQGAGLSTLPASAVSPAGAGHSHVNMMPYLCINFIIALQGEYPQRNQN